MGTDDLECIDDVGSPSVADRVHAQREQPHPIGAGIQTARLAVHCHHGGVVEGRGHGLQSSLIRHQPVVGYVPILHDTTGRHYPIVYDRTLRGARPAGGVYRGVLILCTTHDTTDRTL
jgi:hypothetical protein